jgi:hypothetical protein
LCFACYRRTQRNEERDSWEKADKFAFAIKKAQRKGRQAPLTMINALDDLETAGFVSTGELDQVRAILKPHVDKIGHSLAVVNGEHDGQSERSLPVGTAGTGTSENLPVNIGPRLQSNADLGVKSCNVINDLHHRLGGEILSIGDCEALYVPAWIVNEDWLNRLLDIGWTRERVKLYGKVHFLILYFFCPLGQ